jgi:hypothetical protein
MSAPSLFDWMAEALERGSSLTRLEARGVLRLTLQKAGLDPKDLTAAQAEALLEADLPRDLEDRGITAAGDLCRRIRQELPALSAAAPLSVFDWVAQAVEVETTLSRLEARGTLRLALKAAGLTPERATRRQLEVVLEAVAPKHLRACSVPDPEGVCARIRDSLRSAVLLEEVPGAESPEEIFGRLGGR